MHRFSDFSTLFSIVGRLSPSVFSLSPALLVRSHFPRVSRPPLHHNLSADHAPTPQSRHLTLKNIIMCAPSQPRSSSRSDYRLCLAGNLQRCAHFICPRSDRNPDPMPHNTRSTVSTAQLQPKAVRLQSAETAAQLETWLGQQAKRSFAQVRRVRSNCATGLFEV